VFKATLANRIILIRWNHSDHKKPAIARGAFMIAIGFSAKLKLIRAFRRVSELLAERTGPGQSLHEHIRQNLRKPGSR
jgi:hypothetical protein